MTGMYEPCRFCGLTIHSPWYCTQVKRSFEVTVTFSAIVGAPGAIEAVELMLEQFRVERDTVTETTVKEIERKRK